MKTQIWSTSVCAVMLGLTQAADAADIQFRGFASFVGGSTLTSDETLYGYEDTLNFRRDSLMALQMDAKLDDKLKATMQIIGRGEDGYEPVVEWAYMTYDFSESFQLSAGRIRIPFYRYSDFIDVGYAYNWLGVPQTVYGFDFPGYDGLSGVYASQFGSWDSSFQLIYGQFEGQTGDLDATMEDLKGFSWTMTRDWLTLRAGYMNSKATIDIPDIQGLVAAIQPLVAGAGVDSAGVSSALQVDRDPGDFFGLAVGIDHNNMLFDAEYIEYALDDSLIAETNAYYLTAGYRFGKWIPLLTYSRSKSDPPEDVVDVLPAPAADEPVSLTILRQTLAGAAAATETEIKLIDLALRYDFHHSAAFKLAWTQEENMSGDKNQLLRFGVDLVF